MEVELEVARVTRQSAPVLGAFLIGISLGIFALGAQFEMTCVKVGGEIVGQQCQQMRWGSRVSYWTAVAGGGAFVTGMIAEWRIQRGEE